MVVFHCKWIVWFWTWSLSLSFHFLFPTHGRGYFRLRGLFKNPESLKIVWSPLSCMQPSLKTEPPWSFEFSIVLQWGREGSQWQGLCKEEKKEKEKGPGAESGEGESESLGYEKHCSVTGFTVNFNWFVGARHCAKCLSCMISLILTHTSCSRCLVSCFTDWHPTCLNYLPKAPGNPRPSGCKALELAFHCIVLSPFLQRRILFALGVSVLSTCWRAQSIGLATKVPPHQPPVPDLSGVVGLP